MTDSAASLPLPHSGSTIAATYEATNVPVSESAMSATIIDPALNTRDLLPTAPSLEVLLRFCWKSSTAPQLEKNCDSAVHRHLHVVRPVGMEQAVDIAKHWWNRWRNLVIAVTVAVLLGWHAKTHVELRQALAKPCGLRFKRYVPSAWERHWLIYSKELQGSICRAIRADDKLSGAWLDGLAESWNLGHPINGEVLAALARAPRVFSRYEYTDTCSGKAVDVPIEPLVGLLRHPW